MMKNINQQQHSHHQSTSEQHQDSLSLIDQLRSRSRTTQSTKRDQEVPQRSRHTHQCHRPIDQLIQRLNQFAQLHWSLVHPQLLTHSTLTTIEYRFIKTSSIQQCSQHPLPR
ncbi:hypothetical protein PSTT_01011 [Puccinia striiformis]|uniref:Uncharacterized protein n=1 Tax=Puccinia striiformis TaxID=27350 RepID=A0A2S4W4W6_9BASI|nr:hypothetical protein PSTT_01011 [Puccinia striiformis]